MNYRLLAKYPILIFALLAIVLLAILYYIAIKRILSNETIKKIEEDFKMKQEFDLENLTETKKKSLALNLIEYELTKGNTVDGWKYLKKHELMVGGCLYNGEKFYPVSYDKENGIQGIGSMLTDELVRKYIEKIKNKEYDVEFKKENIEISTTDKFVIYTKALLKK